MKHSTNIRGAALVDYAILLLVIALACITVLTTLGPTIVGMFTQAANAF